MTLNQNNITRPTPAPLLMSRDGGSDNLVMGDMLTHAMELNSKVCQFIDYDRRIAIQWPKGLSPESYRTHETKEPLGPTILSVCEPWEGARFILGSQYDPDAKRFSGRPGGWSHRHLAKRPKEDREAGNAGDMRFYPTVLKPTGLLAKYMSFGRDVADMIMRDSAMDFVSGANRNGRRGREVCCVGDAIQTEWHRLVQAERRNQTDNYSHRGPIDHQSDSWGFEGMS
tara:strand:+ start:517 stop:1197 length:681 start_codon:yes stop_codon:yes gene_type:complete